MQLGRSFSLQAGMPGLYIIYPVLLSHTCPLCLFGVGLKLENETQSLNFLMKWLILCFD